MKTLSIIAAFLLTTLQGFSQYICPSMFKVNNGNGTCGAMGELRLTFPGGCPAKVLMIDSVYIDNVKHGVTFAAPDLSKCAGTNGYVSYCVTSGNMPPVSVWNIYFHDAQGVPYTCTVLSSTVVVLPVKFVSFESVVSAKSAFSGPSVTLKFTAESEKDNDHYELERSFDGTSFNVISYVLTAPNAANGRSNYSYTDRSTSLQQHNVVYYRIKQVDNNGSTTYSKIITVKFVVVSHPEPIYTDRIQIVPSPFTEKLAFNIESTIAASAQIRLLSAAGQPVAVANALVTKGMNSLQFASLGSLSPGVYIAQVSMNGVLVTTQKVVKN